MTISPEKLSLLTDGVDTPFYLYNLSLLQKTLDAVKKAASINDKFHVHYAIKACADPVVASMISEAGLGLDAVSGGEIELGVQTGFNPSQILFAGVGKTDREIDIALNIGIGGFNVESLPELEVISERATALGKTARIALRINPEIDAHTHHYITTGLAENKFGINMSQLNMAVDKALTLPGIEFVGLHFHIGSQITINEPFALLCERVNGILDELNKRGIRLQSLNMGGGLAIDYDTPDLNPVPDFKTYFDTFNNHLDTSAVSEIHFELGRAIMGQCGLLVTRVVYVKEGDTRTFAIVDAGMTELLRPALYGARHAIKNITGILRGDKIRKVDVVGPICESSDVFGQDYLIAAPRRGDILVIESAGAYGQSMSSHYNCRNALKPVYSK